MEAGELLDVVWFEEVSPQHIQMVLDQFGSFFLDRNASGTKHFVVGAVILLSCLQT
jgi:hypothetical protein